MENGKLEKNIFGFEKNFFKILAKKYKTIVFVVCLILMLYWNCTNIFSSFGTHNSRIILSVCQWLVKYISPTRGSLSQLLTQYSMYIYINHGPTRQHTINTLIYISLAQQLAFYTQIQKVLVKPKKEMYQKNFSRKFINLK